MAEQAGIDEYDNGLITADQFAERFHALSFAAGRAAEREECAKDKVDAERCKWSAWNSELGEFESSVYETSCGHTFEFNEGGVSDNGFKFCYCCGKPIEAIDRARSAR